MDIMFQPMKIYLNFTIPILVWTWFWFTNALILFCEMSLSWGSCNHDCTCWYIVCVVHTPVFPMSRAVTKSTHSGGVLSAPVLLPTMCFPWFVSIFVASAMVMIQLLLIPYVGVFPCSLIDNDSCSSFVMFPSCQGDLVDVFICDGDYLWYWC